MRGVAAERPRTRCPPPRGCGPASSRRCATGHRGWVLVADRLAGDAMQPVEAVEAAAPEHGVDGGAGDPERPGDAVRPEPLAAAHGADALLERGCGAAGGWNAEPSCGPGDRLRPPPGSGATTWRTVGRETRKRRATSAWDQPASTSRTSSSRVAGVRRALGCATSGSSPATGAFVTHTAAGGAPHLQQPTWELQLARWPPAPRQLTRLP